MFASDLVMTKVSGHASKYVLEEDLVYKSKTVSVTIPKGFVTDLTTMFPEGRYTVCSVLHDYLLDTGAGWEFANKVFFEALDDESLRVRFITKLLLKTGVTIRKWWVYVFGG